MKRDSKKSGPTSRSLTPSILVWMTLSSWARVLSRQGRNSAPEALDSRKPNQLSFIDFVTPYSLLSVAAIPLGLPVALTVGHQALALLSQYRVSHTIELSIGQGFRDPPKSQSTVVFPIRTY